jgi:hypothetical protein
MVAITIRTNIVKGKKVFLESTWEKFATDILNYWNDSAYKRIKYRAPHNTGNLKKSIKKVKATEGSKTAYVYIDDAKAPYGVWAELGTAPAWIPTEFMWQHDQNPGMRGQHVVSPIWHNKSQSIFRNAGFFKRGLDASFNSFDKYVAKAFNKNLK